MALWMVMTVGLLVSAAWAYRRRQALRPQQQMWPAQQGHPAQTPTVRGVFPSGVGLPMQLGAGPTPLAVHPHARHQLVPRHLGPSDEAL
jgi:hypothetical protein